MIPCPSYCFYLRYLLLLAIFLIHSSSALEVLPSSSCTSVCLDDPQKSSSPGTYGYEIVCKDAQYNSTTNGTRFRSCIDCQLNSAAADKATGQTDLGWALYNLRFAVDWCLLGYPDNKNAASTPCVGSCKTIQDVLKANITAPGLNTPYGYCQDGAFMAGVDLCVSCNALDDNQSYPSNFLRVLKAGCQQQPQPGALLGVSGSIFSSASIVSSGSSASASTTAQSGLSTGAKVGIGLGVPAAVFFFLLIFGFWYQRKRDSRRGHQRMDERWGDQQITSPVPGWTQYRPDAGRVVPQNEGFGNYGRSTYRPEGPGRGNSEGHPDKIILQKVPSPRQKRPVPAVTVDTRHVRRGQTSEDQSPYSLFG